MSANPSAVAGSVPVASTSASNAPLDAPCRGQKGIVIPNFEGRINVATFQKLVDIGDKELVRALIANVLNATEEAIRLGKKAIGKEDIIALALAWEGLATRTNALGFRRVTEAIQTLSLYIKTATDPVRNDPDPDMSRPAVKERARLYNIHMAKSAELLKNIEQETKEAETWMLKYHGEL